MKLALEVTMVGLTVVFAALILLIVIIKLLTKVVPKQGSDDAVEQDSMNEVNCARMEDACEADSCNELIAVLTAAITASMGSRPDVKFMVRSFKRIPQNAPVWNTVGNTEYISAKL